MQQAKPHEVGIGEYLLSKLAECQPFVLLILVLARGDSNAWCRIPTAPATTS
jgi:hypothetical protein